MNPRSAFRRRPRRTAGLAVALGCATAAALAGVLGPAAAGEADAGATLRRDAEAVHRAGAVGVTAVLDTPDGTRAAHSGTADLATGAPARPDARFRAGSTAKPFVATVALRLVAEGELSLDDTVEEWLPGLVAGNGHDGTRVTVRDLLQQTSGLPDYLPRPDVLPAFHSAEGFHAHHLRRYTDEELVEGALRSPEEFAPGSEWGYSNTNYVLVGMIIERVTGNSWQREVRDRVIEPLGLADTETPEDDPYLEPPFLSGHHVFPEGGEYVDTTVFHPSAASAGGALVTTPGDIDRFLTALLGGELLPPEQLDEMLRARDTGREGVGYGLGLFRRELSCGGVYWGHSGTLLGYHNENGVTPDGERAVTVATNSFDFADEAAQDRVDAAMTGLVDRALCAE
ncbi:D-alanyl-D-alanine carboxypeptidase [Streptomyces zhaozhouensis]|uniref:D-alanyl-D-alanine carboxypeptidase n=1 Tax=Streptomyces zhaozhouensis TaxID=1300267 RepID=A0A286DXU2_9ACTN|nr:serine hydrolase domain-containing protein [Streptomyces zhaozhouensis]SOD63485.1 D-alanyl-D-alanine carboxypeptidase [Streptomyces zhaozhouensis]